MFFGGQPSYMKARAFCRNLKTSLAFLNQQLQEQVCCGLLTVSAVLRARCENKNRPCGRETTRSLGLVRFPIRSTPSQTYFRRIRRHTAYSLEVDALVLYKELVLGNQQFHNVALLPPQAHAFIFPFVCGADHEKIWVRD